MTIEALQHFFGWCAVLNYGLLILWFVLGLIARPLLMGLCQKAFRISEETYDRGMFYGIMYYKLGVILLTVIPYIALSIVK